MFEHNNFERFEEFEEFEEFNHFTGETPTQRVLTIQCSSYINNPLASFFIVWGVVQFGFIIGAMIGTLLTQTWVGRLFDKDDEPIVVKQVAYHERYPIKHAIQTEHEMNPHSYVVDNTPEGIAIMKYDKDEEGFVYWGSKKIKYQHLETIARKYVTMFQCKDLYTPRKTSNKDGECDSDCRDSDSYDNSVGDVSENNVSENDGVDDSDNNDDVTDKKKAEEEQKAKNDPFVNFKSYNKTTVSVDKDNNEQSPASGCKFIHKGEFKDFKFTHDKTIMGIDDKPKQKLDFETFKKMFFGVDGANESTRSVVPSSSGDDIDASACGNVSETNAS